MVHLHLWIYGSLGWEQMLIGEALGQALRERTIRPHLIHRLLFHGRPDQKRLSSLCITQTDPAWDLNEDPNHSLCPFWKCSWTSSRNALPRKRTNLLFRSRDHRFGGPFFYGHASLYSVSDREEHQSCCKSSAIFAAFEDLYGGHRIPVREEEAIHGMTAQIFWQ